MDHSIVGVFKGRVLRFLATLALASITARAQSVSPTLKWQPVIENTSIDTDQVFPAEILALATRHPQNVPPRYLGDPNGVLGISLVSSAPDVKVRVSVKVDRLAEESSFEATIPEANQPYEIWPTIRFDTRVLARIRESFPTTALFTVSVNGVLLPEQSRTIQVRSVNDVPYAQLTRDKHLRDLSPLFAAFVDESHPQIDRFLHEALQVNVVQHFSGYQGSPQDVTREVFAIWNVLQRLDVKYSSITTPSGQSQTVLSQHVRFLDEAVQNTLFLGFYTDGQRQQISFLETTMIGNPGLSSLQRSWKFKTADGYLSSESYKQFQNALNAGNGEFQKAAAQFKAKAPGYLLIDIQAARRAGISAIGRF